MAVKICRVCGTPKTVQPRYGNEISYWTCMKCSGPIIKPVEKKHLLIMRTAKELQNLRAA